MAIIEFLDQCLMAIYVKVIPPCLPERLLARKALCQSRRPKTVRRICQTCELFLPLIADMPFVGMKKNGNGNGRQVSAWVRADQQMQMFGHDDIANQTNMKPGLQ